MHLVPHPDRTRPDPAASTFRDVPRAGLRLPPTGGEPTAAFVVVEVTVLVIVAALAMVSIIVSGEDGRGRVERAAVAPVDAGSKHGAQQRFDPRPSNSARRAVDADFRPR